MDSFGAYSVQFEFGTWQGSKWSLRREKRGGLSRGKNRNSPKSGGVFLLRDPAHKGFLPEWAGSFKNLPPLLLSRFPRPSKG